MPGQAADGGDGLELVDNVARDEVDVVMAKADSSITDTLATQLVQFGIVYPLHTLRQWRLVEVQLQPLYNVREVSRVETHHVFGYTRRL